MFKVSDYVPKVGVEVMEYTIKKLAEIAGVSVRTLRYYDEIDLLKPCRISSSGYRIYGEAEVDLLQQIMFYRTLDMKLEEIGRLLYDSNLDQVVALENHLKQVKEKINQLSEVVIAVEKTIACQKGEIKMTDMEKFEVFKKQQVEKNEAMYGAEVREKYNDKIVEASNKQFLNMSKEEYEKMQETEATLLQLLSRVLETGNLESEEAKEVCKLHKQWLGYTWSFYSIEAHKGLAEMYVADERFTAYYEKKAGQGAAEVLRDIIQKYAE